MRHPFDWPAGIGWLGIGIFVGAWDIANRRSLTSFARAHKAATAAIGGVTMAHLLDLIPHRLDPFERVADFFASH